MADDPNTARSVPTKTRAGKVTTHRRPRAKGKVIPPPARSVPSRPRPGTPTAPAFPTPPRPPTEMPRPGRVPAGYKGDPGAAWRPVGRAGAPGQQGNKPGKRVGQVGRSSTPGASVTGAKAKVITPPHPPAPKGGTGKVIPTPRLPVPPKKYRR